MSNGQVRRVSDLVRVNFPDADKGLHLEVSDLIYLCTTSRDLTTVNVEDDISCENVNVLYEEVEDEHKDKVSLAKEVLDLKDYKNKEVI